MPHEVGPSLNERDFIRKALRENVRLDGRALDQYRELDLSFGDEYGVVDVRLGRTRYAFLSSLLCPSPPPSSPTNTNPRIPASSSASPQP